jgi:CBS domain-containing membrane protein
MSLSRLFSLPAALSAGRREMALGTLGVAVGLGCTEWIGYLALGGQVPWFIIPMGASAVLLFCVPASPLAQPWPSLAGNLVSALIGVGCYRWLGETGAAVALAGCLAVGAMFVLRCLHPPGGAVALTAVLGGPLVHELGYGFALMPVLANTLAMLVVAFLFNNLVGRRYPHLAPTRVQPHDTADPLPSKRVGFRAEDLDAALASFGEVLDVDRDDLEEIMVRAQMNARRRTWGALRCADIMSRDVVSVGPQAPVGEAWSLLAHHRIKALPVVEEAGRLVGIVSVPDFFIDRHNPEPQPVPRMSTARVVAEIMSARVRSARPGQSLADLVGAFSDGGLHHLPVADEDGRLVGMITQSDVVAALFAGERTT